MGTAPVRLRRRRAGAPITTCGSLSLGRELREHHAALVPPEVHQEGRRESIARPARWPGETANVVKGDEMSGGMSVGDALNSVLRPVVSSSTAEEVAQQIASIISDGYLKPGDKLPSEHEFALRLNVSRSTIREAKQALAGQGLIQLRGSRGAFVSGHVIARSAINRVIEELSSSMESDLYEARRVVEGAAAALGAARASAADLKGLEKLLAEIKGQSSGGAGPPAAHLRFHIALVETSHNQVLVGLYTQIAHLIENHLGPSYSIIADPASEITSHRQLLKALRSRDPDVAASAMRSHLDDVEELRQRAIRGEISGFPLEP